MEIVNFREREARNVVESNTSLMQAEVHHCMWPWLSNVGLSKDGNIYCYRNQMNHNSITSNLSNKIMNNFLGNPIGADLSGKVHAKDVGTDTLCFLTYNDKVSNNAMSKEILQFVKINPSFLHFVKIFRASTTKVQITTLNNSSIADLC